MSDYQRACAVADRAESQGLETLVIVLPNGMLGVYLPELYQWAY